jgi:uncharacterized membrane protein YhaH (DUF805 family)
MWYFQNEGLAKGPFNEYDILKYINEGVITKHTPVWAEGMPDWQSAGNTELVVHFSGTPPPIKKLPSATPPPIVSRVQTYPQAPSVSHAFTSNQIKPKGPYLLPTGRIGRGSWFIRNFAQTLFCGLLIAPFKDAGDSWTGLVALVWIYVTIVCAGKRLHDLNVSAWLSPIVFIPLVPLFLACLSGTNGTNKYGAQSSNK